MGRGDLSDAEWEVFARYRNRGQVLSCKVGAHEHHPDTQRASSRIAFHQYFDKEVVRFFSKTLAHGFREGNPGS